MGVSAQLIVAAALVEVEGGRMENHLQVEQCQWVQATAPGGPQPLGLLQRVLEVRPYWWPDLWMALAGCQPQNQTKLRGAARVATH